MDLVLSSRKLISDMIELAGSQMKLLLMDSETTPCVSCAFAQSELMQKEVYMFDRIDNIQPVEALKNVKCIVFVRPTTTNINFLMKQLQNPQYNHYYLFFSGPINKYDLKQLAESDKNETVREVQEIFLDGIPLRKDLYSLNINNIYDSSFYLKPMEKERIKCGVISLLLQMRKNPAIRYLNSSQNSAKIAEEVSQFIRRENSLFKHPPTDTLLLIVERSFDVVTPLLNQWTYEAMIHELLEITNNRLICEGQNIVLNEIHDEFFSENIVSNFGEIGQNIKNLISEFQEKRQINKNLDSIHDMKKFVEDYPQFKKISGTVSKHVGLVGELSRLIQKYNLLELSETEQSIVAEADHNKCIQDIRTILKNPNTRELDVFRLILLYAIRFETFPGNEIKSLVNQQKNIKLQSLINNCLNYGGAKKQPHDIFGGQSTIDITKRFIKGLKGVENIYTQHSPYLKAVIDNMQRGKFDNFPLIEPSNCERIENLIIFVVGGATYEEAAVVRSANARRGQGHGGPSIILGSNCILNTKMFVNQLLS